MGVLGRVFPDDALNERVVRSWESFLRNTEGVERAEVPNWALMKTIFMCGALAGVEAAAPDRCPNPHCSRAVAHKGECW